ncbi:hypothetical protein REPUB_Repub10bG0021500 [Reevesia pubescens]
MNCFIKHFSSLILFLLLLTWCDAFGLRPKIHVQITNDVGEGLDLIVHCRSRDDDLGIQVIAYQNFWEFHFRPKFFSTTQFYCSMAWKDAFHWFDIFINDRDSPKCRVCGWSIKPKGPCRFNKDTNKFDICFKWN